MLYSLAYMLMLAEPDRQNLMLCLNSDLMKYTLHTVSVLVKCVNFDRVVSS